jgi:hypothetical protein
MSAGQRRCSAPPPGVADVHVSTRWARVTAAIALALLCGGAPVAQEVTGPALKAAFLFNFVKFTQWPAVALADTAALTMCVVQDPAVGDALAQAVRNRVVQGREIRVAQPQPGETLRQCHVLYVSGARPAVEKVVATVADAPVLTVSDVRAFADIGGVAQLHVQQGQLRFAIAVDAARRSGLQISSRLLALSRQP